MDNSKKWSSTKILLSIAAVFFVIFAVLTSLLWYRTWTPFMDDGPFHGIPCADLPDREPDQSYEVYSKYFIEVYDRRGKTNTAPIVLLRDKNNDILWSIYAVADNMDKATVERIRFKKYRHFPFKKPRILAMVDWTYGNEASWWYISENGKLQEYWYSW